MRTLAQPLMPCPLMKWCSNQPPVRVYARVQGPAQALELELELELELAHRWQCRMR